MKKLLRKENLMLTLIILFLICQEILSDRTAFDFHLYDTYIIIAKPYIFFIIFFYTLIVYACYFLFRKNKKKVSKIIAIIQITGLLLLIIQMASPVYYEGLAGMPRRYYDFSVWGSFKDFVSMNKWATFSALYFILSQVLFFIYFLIVLIQYFFIRK